jgi:hypothetical protein
MDGVCRQVRPVARDRSPKRRQRYRSWAKQSERFRLGLRLPGETLAEKPEGYELILGYRLTGLTPDELATQRADRWQIAVDLRNAIAEGVAAAHSEKAGWDKLDGMQVAEAG